MSTVNSVAIDQQPGAVFGPVPTHRPWRAAVLAPVLLALPWLGICRLTGAPEALGTMTALVLVLVLGTATVTDLLWRRIFNWTTYTALAWGLVLHVAGLLPIPGQEWLGALPLSTAIQGLLMGFGLTLLAFLAFRGGAGDVKLVTVLGLLLGSDRILEVIFYGYLFAALFAIAYLVWSVGPLTLLVRLLLVLGLPAGLPGAATDLRELLRQRLPMAPFLTAGVIAALVQNF
jgi:Flp pilus assembly protein protease CpaA